MKLVYYNVPMISLLDYVGVITIKMQELYVMVCVVKQLLIENNETRQN